MEKKSHTMRSKMCIARFGPAVVAIGASFGGLGATAISPDNAPLHTQAISSSAGGFCFSDSATRRKSDGSEQDLAKLPSSRCVAAQIGPAHNSPDDSSLSASEQVDRKVQQIAKEKIDNATKIARLQQLQREHPSVFSWALHNELRDLYTRVNRPEAALKECDILLSHSVMDGYVLDILSKWDIRKAPKRAIQTLIQTATNAKDCPYVKAACWLQVGDIYQKLGDTTSAKVYYRKVVARDSKADSQYQKLAKERLGATAKSE